jgi:pyridoxamine 5'-phosphate oxidase
MLREEDVDPDPIEQFARWYREALAANPRADAMAVGTSTLDGRPSVRMVLLKGFDHRGFVFFTNYESRKGAELAENPKAALTFSWPEPEPSRQVRITGHVDRLSEEESAAYFRTRPRESQIAAWASRQSEVIESRAALEQEYSRVAELYEGREVPLPPAWGGLRVVPHRIEFWQHRESRLHDRLRYVHEADGTWRLERLAP